MKSVKPGEITKLFFPDGIKVEEIEFYEETFLPARAGFLECMKTLPMPVVDALKWLDDIKSESHSHPAKEMVSTDEPGSAILIMDGPGKCANPECTNPASGPGMVARDKKIYCSEECAGGKVRPIRPGGRVQTNPVVPEVNNRPVEAPKKAEVVEAQKVPEKVSTPTTGKRNGRAGETVDEIILRLRGEGKSFVEIATDLGNIVGGPFMPNYVEARLKKMQNGG